MEMPLELKREIMLQINTRLYIQGHISQEMYEQAKVRILERTGTSSASAG